MRQALSFGEDRRRGAFPSACCAPARRGFPSACRGEWRAPSVCCGGSECAPRPASRLLAIGFRPRAMRQLIVNACSLSKVAFMLLASFRGLAVSPFASFERLTLYHSRVIKQAVIFRAVFRSRPDLRCIEGHRRRPSPSSPKFCPMCAGFAATRPLIAVSLSRLASAISMAHNAQSTLPIQLVASTQNAEAPAVGCGGRFGRKLSGESCLIVVW